MRKLIKKTRTPGSAARQRFVPADSSLQDGLEDQENEDLCRGPSGLPGLEPVG